jgi:hypothetical protein
MKTRRRTDSMIDLSPEQRRDMQKQRAGSLVGYRFSPEEEREAMRLAAGIVSGEVGIDEVPSTLARNIWSELRAEGHKDLAQAVHDRWLAPTAEKELREMVRSILCQNEE